LSKFEELKAPLQSSVFNFSFNSLLQIPEHKDILDVLINNKEDPKGFYDKVVKVQTDFKNIITTVENELNRVVELCRNLCNRDDIKNNNDDIINELYQSI